MRTPIAGPPRAHGPRGRVGGRSRRERPPSPHAPPALLAATAKIVVALALCAAAFPARAAAQLPDGVADAIATVLAALTPSPTPGTPTPSPTAGTPTPSPTGTTTQTPTPTGTATVTPTATVTRAPTFDAAATPAPGGSVSVVSESDVHGVDGESVEAGQFRIRNTTSSTETVTEIRVESSDAAMFSSLTLTADGRSVTISEPSTENSFFFEPGIEIAPGGSVEAALTAVIGSAGTATSTATPETTHTASTTQTPTVTPGAGGAASLAGRGPGQPSGPSSGGGDRRARDGAPAATLAFALLALVAWRSRSRRARAALLVFAIAIYGGCGSEQTSAQTVTGITASNGEGPVTMSGIPASLGTVSRPQPLVFPGAKSS
jgi:hypothetical protein